MPGRDVIEQLGTGPVILPSLLLCDFANLQREVEQLTPREKEVLLEVAQGATNREVAEKLVISEYTARNMVSNMLGKLGLRSRSELVRWAFERDMMKGAPGQPPPADFRV